MEMPTTKPNEVSGRRLLVVAILAGLVLLAGAVAFFGRGAAEPGPPVTGVTEVAVRDNEFAPAAIAVPAGSTVTWQWEGANEHNVVADGFESPIQAEGEFAHTFTEPGTYPYECTLHRSMRGEVVVES